MTGGGLGGVRAAVVSFGPAVLGPAAEVLPDFFTPVLVFLSALDPLWQLALAALLLVSALVSTGSIVYFCIRYQRNAARGDLDESEDEREEDELELERERSGRSRTITKQMATPRTRAPKRVRMKIFIRQTRNHHLLLSLDEANRTLPRSIAA